MSQREDQWRHWAEGQNAALRDAIRKAGTKGNHSSSGAIGATAGLGVLALLLGVAFLLALPIIYPSFLVGRLVADAVHPLIGILVGLGLFAAALSALYFSRLARAIYAFPFAFAVQLLIFKAVGSSSDFVWASGASLLAGFLLYRLAFSVMRLRDQDDAIPAWLVSGALAVVSLAPNFLVAIYAPRDVAPISRTSDQPPGGIDNPQQQRSALNPPAAYSGMILPQSERRLLAPTDVAHLSVDDLRIARNEIFARRGRAFSDPALRAHFEQFGWYRPSSDEVQLSDLEAANVRFLSEEEERRAARSNEASPLSEIEPTDPVPSTEPLATDVYGLVVRRATSQELATLGTRATYGLIIVDISPDSAWQGSRSDQPPPQIGDFILSGIGGGMWTDPAEFQRYVSGKTYRVCVDGRYANPVRTTAFCRTP